MTATLRSAEFQRKAGIVAGFAWLLAMAGLTLAACLSGGCGSSALAVHAGVADATGEAITAAGAELLEHRERALHEAIDAAPTREVAEQGVEVVRERYESAVLAYDALRLAHDAYVDVLVLAAAGDVDDPARWARIAARVVVAWQAWAETGRALALDVPAPPAMLLSVAVLAGGADVAE
jgi:hypothetical protein